MIQQNPFSATPNLRDILNMTKQEVMQQLNCHALATIQSFNATTQTASATINYQKTIYSQASGGTVTSKGVSWPVLVNCPVYFPQGGGGALTFPVQAGDQALVAFNDRDMSTWLATSTVTQTSTGRLHSFSDAIMFVGVNPFSLALTNFDANRAVLRKGTAAIGVRSDTNKVLVTNAYAGSGAPSTTLNTLLQNLMTELGSLCTAIAAITVTGVSAGGGVSGIPANAAAITAIGTEISATATSIAALLE